MKRSGGSGFLLSNLTSKYLYLVKCYFRSTPKCSSQIHHLQKISLTTGVDSGIFPDSNTIPGWILNCSNLQTNDTYIYIYLYNKLSPLFSSYHILTSSVICYWTDTLQLGIYLLNISGMFQTNVKLTLDATWYFFLHGVWSAVYKWFQCQSDWTGCEMCQRSFRPQRQILSLLFIWHTACVIWSSQLGMLQKWINNGRSFE